MEEKNFYELGKEFANETIKDMEKKAQEIGDQYGVDAQLEFEAGIVSTISRFEEFYGIEDEEFDIDNLSGTINYGHTVCRDDPFIYGVGKGKAK